MRNSSSAVNETARGLAVAFHQEGDDAAGAAHLRAGNAVIRMRFQSRIPDLFDLGMRFQESRHFQAGAIVVVHAQAESLQSAFEQEATERPGHGADHALQLVEFLQLFVAAERDARQQVVVPAEIFRGGMDDDVHAHFQRPDVVRRRQRGINHRQNFVAPGDFDDGRDVQHAQVRIGGRFGENDVRVRAGWLFQWPRRSAPRGWFGCRIS